MAKTEINLRKVKGKRQRGRTEKSELIPFLRLNPVLFTTRDEKKYDLDYDLVKDIQTVFAKQTSECFIGCRSGQGGDSSLIDDLIERLHLFLGEMIDGLSFRKKLA